MLRIFVALHLAVLSMTTTATARVRDERGSLSTEQAIVTAALAGFALVVVGGIGAAVAKYMGAI